MRTRCKFVVESVTKFTGNNEQVKLRAMYSTDPDPEARSFSAATPSGDLTITVSNPEVVGMFLPGQYFYLDLIPVEQPVEQNA